MSKELANALKALIEAGRTPEGALNEVYQTPVYRSISDAATKEAFDMARNDRERSRALIGKLYRTFIKHTPGQAPTPMEPKEADLTPAEYTALNLPRHLLTAGSLVAPVAGGAALAARLPAAIPNAVRLAAAQGMIQAPIIAAEQAVGRMTGQSDLTPGQMAQSAAATTFGPPIVETLTRLPLPGGPGVRKALAAGIGAAGNVAAAAAQPGDLGAGAALLSAGTGALGGAMSRAIQENVPDPKLFKMFREQFGWSDADALAGARLGNEEALQNLLNLTHANGAASAPAKEAAAALRNALQGTVGLALDPTDVEAPRNLTTIKQALNAVREDARASERGAITELLNQARVSPNAIGTEKYDWAFKQIQQAIADEDQAAAEQVLQMLGRGTSPEILEAFWQRVTQNLNQLKAKVSTPYVALANRPEMAATIADKARIDILDSIMGQRQFLTGAMDGPTMPPGSAPSASLLDRMQARLMAGQEAPLDYRQLFAFEKDLRAARDRARNNRPAWRAYNAIRERVLDAIESRLPEDAPGLREINAAYRSAHVNVIDPLEAPAEIGGAAGRESQSLTAIKRATDPGTMQGKAIRQLQPQTAEEDLALLRQIMGADSVDPDLAGATKAAKSAVPGAKEVAEQNLAERAQAALRADKPGVLVDALLPDVAEGMSGSDKLIRAQRGWQAVERIQSPTVRESLIAGTLEDAIKRFRTEPDLLRAIRMAESAAGYDHPLTRALTVRLELMRKGSPLDKAMAIQSVLDAGAGAGTMAKLFAQLENYDPGSPEIWRIVMSNLTPEAAEIFRQGFAGSLLVGASGPDLNHFIKQYGKMRPQVEAILGPEKAGRLSALHDYLANNDSAVVRGINRILGSVDPTFVSQARGLAAFAGALRLGMGIQLPVMPTMLAAHIYPIAAVDQIVNGPGSDNWMRALTRTIPAAMARPEIRRQNEPMTTEYGRPGAVR